MLTFLNYVTTYFRRRKTRKILRDARALVEQGWIKHQYRLENESGAVFYCASGALQAASGWSWAAGSPTPSADRAFYDADFALHKVVPLDQSVVAFNDSSETKKEDVLALFDKAIANTHVRGTV